MSQSRRHSLLEAVCNIVVGYGINVLGQTALFPLFGIEVAFTVNLAISAAFTVLSLARSYILRRMFNALHAGAL